MTLPNLKKSLSYGHSYNGWKLTKWNDYKEYSIWTYVQRSNLDWHQFKHRFPEIKFPDNFTKKRSFNWEPQLDTSKWIRLDNYKDFLIGTMSIVHAYQKCPLVFDRMSFNWRTQTVPNLLDCIVRRIFCLNLCSTFKFRLTSI